MVFLLSNMAGIITSYVLFFYTTVVLLPIELYMIANTIFIVWNMVNDPILGYYSDKSTRWVKRYGKRYPFIIIGISGTAIMLILVFVVPVPNPQGNPMAVFFWLLIVLILYDTFFALYMVNIAGLFQYKIRDDADRRISGAFLIVTGSIGMMLPTILLPIIVESIGRTIIFAWTVQAIVFAAVHFVIIFLMRSGIRESEEMKRHWETIDLKERPSFLKALTKVLRIRSYNAFIISALMYSMTTSVAMASLPFFIVYVLGSDLTGVTLPMLMFLIVTPLSTPIWIKLGNKWGSKKAYTLGFLMIMVIFLPMLWIQNYILIVIFFGLLGVGFGSQIFQHPIDADIIEEASIKTGTRSEGLYNGIQTFIITSALAAQVLIIGSVQILSGFDAQATIQSAEAILGLRSLISIVPMILMAIGVIIFWIFYDITPKKKLEIEAKLKELGL